MILGFWVLNFWFSEAGDSKGGFAPFGRAASRAGGQCSGLCRERDAAI